MSIGASGGFGRAKAKKIFVRPSGHVAGDINVTPLVDVVLVLLIIFMVVTPLLEKDIFVQVPSTETVEQVTDVPPDQLVVRLAADGTITLNGEAIPLAEYIDRLRSRLEPRGAVDKVVFLTSEDAANYGTLVSLLDGAKVAGAVTLGMATDGPGSNEK